MTPADVVTAVLHIAEIRGDDEAAHSAEDDLYLAVLREIANGHDDPRALALNAIEASEIGFSRWCA